MSAGADQFRTIPPSSVAAASCRGADGPSADGDWACAGSAPASTADRSASSTAAKTRRRARAPRPGRTEPPAERGFVSASKLVDPSSTAKILWKIACISRFLFLGQLNGTAGPAFRMDVGKMRMESGNWQARFACFSKDSAFGPAITVPSIPPVLDPCSRFHSPVSPAGPGSVFPQALFRRSDRYRACRIHRSVADARGRNGPGRMRELPRWVSLVPGIGTAGLRCRFAPCVRRAARRNTWEACSQIRAALPEKVCNNALTKSERL